ncbi:MAG: sigma-70 family RNA polymerase sigma factor [Planctomycetota bacterium]
MPHQPSIRDDVADDQQLLDAIAATDEHTDDAIEALYQRYRQWALDLALSMTRDDAASLDACQDAWMEAIKRARRGVTLRARFTTFLYKYVKHAALRAKRSRPITSEAPDPVATPSPANPDLTSIHAALDRLKPAHAEVLRLRYWHDLTDREIAIALGKPLGTVKGRLRKAIARLEEILKSA